MDIISFIIFLICLSGASWQAYRQGIREGCSKTIDKLHAAKVISYDNKGNIVPNSFFNS